MSYKNKNTSQHIPPMMRGIVGGKAKNFKKAWGNLISYTKPFYKFLIIAIVFSIITTAITLTGPNLIEKITNLISDGLLGTINLNKITKITIILATLYIFSAIINYLSSFTITAF